MDAVRVLTSRRRAASANSMLRKAAPAIPAAITFLSMLLPLPAEAQWDKLIGDVQQVSVTSSCWRWQAPLERSCGVRGGVGLELGYAVRSFNVGKIGVEVDLGLGYTESNPFEQIGDSVRFRGVARERPALSVCLATGYKIHAAFFACGRTGLLDLHDTQAWDSTSVSTTNTYTGSGSIFQLGGAVGVAVGREPLLLTAQVSRMWRRFDAISWKGEAQKTIPPALPRSLDLSGYGLTIGLSVQVREAKDDDDKQALAPQPQRIPPAFQ